MTTLYTRIAHVYLRTPVVNTDETMLARYGRLKTELWAQYQLLTTFVDVRFTRIDPYATSREMFRSVEAYRALYVYTDNAPAEPHPLAESAPNGQSFNSIFRAVHDGLAHYPERNSFSFTGELNAFRAHARQSSS